MPQQFSTRSAGESSKRNQGMTSELFLSRVLAMDCVPRVGEFFDLSEVWVEYSVS
jgi:hypothetical protein